MSELDLWWNRRGEVVEAFNKRRGGQSGVEKIPDSTHGLLYIKKQIGHIFRSFRYPLGRPTAIRERDAYRAFKKIGLNVPELVFVDAKKERGNWRAVLVTKNLENFITLRQWYTSGGPAQLGEEDYRQFLQKLGTTLGLLHRHRWCHGSLHFSHIYVRPNDTTLPEIAFLDLERAQHKFSRQQAAQRDLHTLTRRAPLVHGKPILSEQDWYFLLEAHKKSLYGS